MVCGLGAVGARVARYLISSDDVGTLVVTDSDRKRRATVAGSLGPRARSVDSPDEVDDEPIDIVVLATPASRQAALASSAMAAGRHVVATADSLNAVRALLDLDPEARERGVSVIVGAGFSPGLSCILARHAATQFDQVDEIHMARSGTGGPSCARQHHTALLGRGIDWRDRAWKRRPPGSGRELSFFPDPIGGADCYRAALPDALLLVPVFPGVEPGDRPAGGHPPRPVHRRPADAAAAAPRGADRWPAGRGAGPPGPAHDTVVLGAIDRPAVAAATVAGLTARWIGAGRVEPGRRGLAGRSSRCGSCTSCRTPGCGPRCSRARAA